MKYFPLILAFGGLLAGCDACTENKIKSAQPEDAARVMNENLDFLWRTLPLGTPRSEALFTLPKAHNTDTDNVAMWVWPSDQASKLNLERPWRELYLWNDGYFIVFVDGKVATPPLSISSYENPWFGLLSYTKMSRSEIEAVLGTNSKIVWP